MGSGVLEVEEDGAAKMGTRLTGFFFLRESCGWALIDNCAKY
jgi:hypothetical protein